jgi:hypothetical protein
MQEILAVKRSKNESVFSKPTEPIKNEKADLSTLVASVKRKTEKMKSKRS